MDDPAPASVNEHILELLPPEAERVLDVGCAGGALGAAIKSQRPRAVVHGLERSPQALDEARTRLDRVFEVDLDLPFGPLDGPYDCIVCGDVLEHLVDPWSTLRTLVDHHLAPEGRVVASIPNVRYHKVVRDLLLRGRFTYQPTGILDATHLRFFTRQSMEALFEGAGLKVVAEIPRLGGRNLLVRLLGLVSRSGVDLRTVQYTLLGRRG